MCAGIRVPNIERKKERKQQTNGKFACTVTLLPTTMICNE